MTYTPKRVLVWTLYNTALFVLAYVALVMDIQGATNVLIATAWLLCVSSFATYVPEAVRQNHTKRRAVPEWLDTMSNVGLTGVLVWYGWWFTAIALVIHHINIRVFWEKVAEYNDQVDSNDNM